jgi:hypothetical protein
MRADDKLETNKLYYQLDPLSRRSLLIHPATLELESGSSTDFFALSSARSAHVREIGIEMRALGGGEGGVLDLTRITSSTKADGSIVGIFPWAKAFH